MSRMTKASSTDEAFATWTDTTGTCSASAVPPSRSRHDPAQPNPRPRATTPPPRAGAARRPALTLRPAARAAPGHRRVTSRIPPAPAHRHAGGRACHIYLIWRASVLIGVGPTAAPIGGSARVLLELLADGLGLP